MQRQVDFWEMEALVDIEFQASQGYTGRPLFKKKNVTILFSRVLGIGAKASSCTWAVRRKEPGAQRWESSQALLNLSCSPGTLRTRDQAFSQCVRIGGRQAAMYRGLLEYQLPSWTSRTLLSPQKKLASSMCPLTPWMVHYSWLEKASVAPKWIRRHIKHLLPLLWIKYKERAIYRSDQRKCWKVPGH